VETKNKAGRTGGGNTHLNRGQAFYKIPVEDRTKKAKLMRQKKVNEAPDGYSQIED
jgi:hypothetical protein